MLSSSEVSPEHEKEAAIEKSPIKVGLNHIGKGLMNIKTDLVIKKT